MPHIVDLSRRIQLSACHRLHSPHLSPEENLAIYGKCNHINGHGHNYEIVVTIRGPVDEQTGMVMNVQTLNDAMKKTIMRTMDHKNLDVDIDFFHDKPSTTENVAIYIWKQLQTHLERPELLYEVKIKETENNFVAFHG